ncbi:hypothetical protein STANM309S_06461 [Streptomyces tanashiensis]
MAAAARRPAALTIGLLGDGTDLGALLLADAYRRQYPSIEVRVREADLTDPTCGLRAGLVDIALTRAPSTTPACACTSCVKSVGAVLHADDPLAGRTHLRLADLAGRRWFQFPDGTDPLWWSYWNGDEPREGPVVRAVQECPTGRAVERHGRHDPPRTRHARGTDRRSADRHQHRRVVAVNADDTNPLIPPFVQIAEAASSTERLLRHRPQPRQGSPPQCLHPGQTQHMRLACGWRAPRR